MCPYIPAYYICTYIQVVVRAWSRKDAYNQTEFALGVAVDVLRYYEEFFDIPYPLPKQGLLMGYRMNNVYKRSYMSCLSVTCVCVVYACIVICASDFATLMSHNFVYD